MERRKKFLFFFKWSLLKTRSIATKTSFLVKRFADNYQKKSCFHLSLSLLNETPKRQTFQIKVVEDLKLSFDSYQILVSLWTLLPTVSSVKVVLYLLSKSSNEAKISQFFYENSWSLSFDSFRNLMPGYNKIQQLPEKQSASSCCQICWVKHQSGNLFEWRLVRTSNYRSIATKS